jgi:hypothetical protein
MLAAHNLGETPMAKKARKKAGKKLSKKSAKKSAAKAKNKTKKKSAAKKAKPARKKKRAAKGLGAKVAGAYRAVVDTIKGTDQLRNKMEQPGTSESE